MPYEANTDLPDNVKNNLPDHAQDIYREAFNNAWEQYADPQKRIGSAGREEAAHKVAWAAVKKEYRKDNSGGWSKK